MFTITYCFLLDGCDAIIDNDASDIFRNFRVVKTKVPKFKLTLIDTIIINSIVVFSIK